MDYVLTMLDRSYCVVTEAQMATILASREAFVALPDGQVKARHQVVGFTPLDLYVKQDRERLSERGKYRCAYGMAHEHDARCYCGGDRLGEVNLGSPFLAPHIREAVQQRLLGGSSGKEIIKPL